MKQWLRKQAFKVVLFLAASVVAVDYIDYFLPILDWVDDVWTVVGLALMSWIVKLLQRTESNGE